MTRTLRGAVFSALLAWSAAPVPARAFEEPLLFKAGTLQGGGGGRFFTGSPADGYSCKVCHRGGTPPTVEVAGLPIDGFVPGRPYDVQLSWDNLTPHAMAVEFTTPEGVGAGTVALVEPSLVDASGRCGGTPDGQIASGVTQEGTRTIILVPDCGATTLRLRYTAPTDGQDVIFAGGVVSSNKSKTSEGDGVLELRHALRSSGAPNTATSGGCSVAGTDAAWSGSSLALWLWAVCWARRRRLSTT